ncbi:uncharacterized protein CXorf58 homolog isoform X2 [Engraulis encrasicolus]|uniref:uncharacterized protein CXorf58 homolog isoform X2 n=1 Tax=Engraulis encrasicolus TaxID=184585 RepID=UPI002FD2A3C2
MLKSVCTDLTLRTETVRPGRSRDSGGLAETRTCSNCCYTQFGRRRAVRLLPCSGRSTHRRLSCSQTPTDRARFSGPQFPPHIVFKIFQASRGQCYISGKKTFKSTNEATTQACRIMGNRKFLSLLLSDEEQRGRGQIVADASDVVCMRDYMQYSSHLDELPAYLGGRSNGWRLLTLGPRSSTTYTHTHSCRSPPEGALFSSRCSPTCQLHSQRSTAVQFHCSPAGTTAADRSVCICHTPMVNAEARLPGRRSGDGRSPVAPPTSRQLSASSPAASRLSSRRSRAFHRAMSRKMKKLYITGEQNPEARVKQDRSAVIIPPPASLLAEEDQEAGFTTSPFPLSDESEWEDDEEVVQLCDWSQNLGEELEENIEPKADD